MTKQDLLYEYGKSMLDIEYFAKTYCKVWYKEKQQYVPFELLPQQLEVINAYQTSNRTLVAKYRQGGITTVTQLYLAHCLVFRKDIKIGVAANKLLLAKEIFAGITSIINQLPIEIFNRQPTDKNSQSHVKYNNGAQLMAFAASKNGVRGFAPDILFIDEAAFLDEGVDFMKSANGTMASGGQIMLVSTPNGNDLVYYTTYDAAQNKRNNYKVVEINWYNDPRYNKLLSWISSDGETIKTDVDPKEYQNLKLQGFRPSSPWYLDICATMNNDPRTIAQELENKFLGSGGHLINEQTILKIERDVREPIRLEYDQNFWIWEDFIEGYKYYLSCDVAKGTGDGDYTTIQLFKEDPIEHALIQVAEYQGRIPLEVAGELCYKYATRYGNAYVIVDISGGWGIVVIKKFTSMNYKNIHYDKPRENDIKVQNKDLIRGEKMPGYTISNKFIRDNIVREFERMLREGNAIIYSRRLLSEIKTFVFNSSLNRYDHSRSTHDDLIMATAMLFGVYMQSLFNGNETALYLKLAQSVLVRKGDEYLNDSKEYEKNIIQQHTSINKPYVEPSLDDTHWYNQNSENKKRNPYILVR